MEEAVARRWPTVTERFLKYCEPRENGCIEWIGARSKSGYGSFYWDGKNLRAHRAAWLLKHGQIPSGLKVCHKCDNPRCVNTDHLFLGTQKDNQQDCAAKGRFWQQRVVVTHCSAGHEFNEQNTYIKPNGNKNCRPCQRQRSREYYRRKGMGPAEARENFINGTGGGRSVSWRGRSGAN